MKSVIIMKKALIMFFITFSIIVSLSAEFSVFFTNDTHGRVLPGKNSNTLYFEEEVKVGGATYLSSLYKKLGDEAGQSMLIDAGDIFDGAYINDKFEGEPQMKVMNNMGYDIYVPGNHDFAFGLDKLKQYSDEAGFTTLCTNLVDNKSYSSFFRSHIIKDIHGVKVGFLGFLLEKTKKTFDNYTKRKVDVLDPFEVGKNWMKYLREKEKCDLIILITHLGYDADQVIARELEPDFIIGGHSHTALTIEKKIGNTVIMQAGSYYRNLGHLTLNIDDRKLESYKYRLYSVSSKYSEPDPEIVRILAPYEKEVNGEIDEKIYYLSEPLKSRPYKKNNKLYLFLCQNFEKATGADLALLNVKGIRESLPAGDITRRDIYNTLPFGNQAVKARIKGHHLIRDKSFYDYKGILKADQYYWVVTNSYIAQRSYLFTKYATEKYELEKSVRDYIADYLRSLIAD